MHPRLRLELCLPILYFASSVTLHGQCAMCKAAVANAADGGALARGLNQGILFLLAIPILLVGGISFLIWRSYRQLRDPGGVV